MRQRADESVRIIGVPKTIDNELNDTNHAPGYGSAAKFVAAALGDIYCDSGVYNTKSVTVVEIMGRNAGWLTAASILSRHDKCGAPHLVYMSEKPFIMDEFLEDIARTDEKNIIVAVSEGIKDERGHYISKSESDARDEFGHTYLGGWASKLAGHVWREFGYKTRAVELSILQRSFSSVASKRDLDEAFLIR